MYPNASGTLSFQFAHLLPALLAQAHVLGGDRLMFAATPMIGGVALLAFFVAAWRLLRNPFVALAALVSFAFLLPVVSFSRDSYSEIPMQLLVFTALWILTDRVPFLRPRVAFVAGLFLGHAAGRADRRARRPHRPRAVVRGDVVASRIPRPPVGRGERGRVRGRARARASCSGSST